MENTVQEEMVPKKEAMEEEDIVAPSGEDICSEMSFPSVQKCVFCNLQISSQECSKILECLHAICANCFGSWAEGPNNLDGQPATAESNTRNCPECSILSRRSHIIDNKFISEVGEGNTSGSQEDNGSPLCSCDDHRPATDWCETCRDYICQECTFAHKQLTCTKDHVIRPKDEGGVRRKGGGDSDKYPCPNHPKELLTLYCISCDTMTCRDCQLGHHRGHKYKFIEEIANDAKTDMKAQVLEVLYKVNIVNSGVQVLDDKTKKIQEKKVEIIKEIKDFIRKTTDLIQKMSKELLMTVNQACSSKLVTYDRHRQALMAVSSQASHCADFVNKALAMGSDSCLLHAKQQMLSHLSRIKAKKTQVPNPDFPVTINLVKCQMELLDLILQNFLALQVDNQLLPPSTKHKQLQSLLQLLWSKLQQPPPQHPPAPPRQQVPTAVQQQQQQQQQGLLMQQQQQQQHQQQLANQQQQQLANQQLIQQHQHTISYHPNPQHQAKQPAPQHQQVVPKQQSHSAGLSPSLQELQKLQYQPQNRTAQQFHAQGGVPLRQQQVTSSTHPQQRPVNDLLYKQQARANQQVAYRGASGSPDQGYTAAGTLSACSYQQQPHLSIHPLPQRTLAYQQYQRSGITLTRTPPRQQHQIPQIPHMQIIPQAQPASSASPLGSIPWHIPQREPTTAIPNYHGVQQAPVLQQAATLPVSQASPTVHNPQLHVAITNSGQHQSTCGQVQQVQQQDDSSYKIRLTSPAVSSSVPKTPSPVTRAVSKTPSPVTPAVSKTPDVLDALSDAYIDEILDNYGDYEKTGEACSSQQLAGPSVAPAAAAVTNEASPSKSALSNGEEKVTEVHSSTTTPPAKDSTNPTQGENDDPNDDWCAVCMDGGDLVCCDNCPKVFHTACHIPRIETGGPEELWQCLLCRSIAPIKEVTKKRGRSSKGLNEQEQMILERVVLELYCQYEVSLHFRAPVPPENMEYFKKVRNPMSFDQIRARLSAVVPSQKYASVHQAIRDIRQVFRNAFNYYEIGSKEYHDGMQLEEFLEILLSTYLPQFAHTNLDQDSEESDDEVVTPVRKVRRVID